MRGHPGLYVQTHPASSLSFSLPLSFSFTLLSLSLVSYSLLLSLSFSSFLSSSLFLFPSLSSFLSPFSSLPLSHSHPTSPLPVVSSFSSTSHSCPCLYHLCPCPWGHPIGMWILHSPQTDGVTPPPGSARPPPRTRGPTVGYCPSAPICGSRWESCASPAWR